MKIKGFQKMTLLDYPGKVACTVFTAGCNFRCPFCHNASLVIGGNDNAEISEEEIFSYLEKRKGILDGVCITGGEPLLHKDISEFISRIKEMGYLVKLDTNGSMPERLKGLVDSGLVDYVAMDIKNCASKYSKTAGIDRVCVGACEESIDFLLEGRVDYEFRTTVSAELHTVEDIEQIAKRIESAPRYFLQNFVDSGDIIGENLSAVDSDTLEQMRNLASQYVQFVQIRGV